MKSNKLIIAALIGYLFTLISCNTTEPPPTGKGSAALTLEDVSCTEAWLSLTTTNIQLPTAIDLIQNENIRKTINLTTADTVLYIDSLLPNQTYKFKISGSESPASGATKLQPLLSTQQVATLPGKHLHSAGRQVAALFTMLQ